MNCYEFENNLSDFIEGELKQKDNFNFKTHQKKCNLCSAKLKSMLTLVSNIGQMRTMSVPSNFTKKLHYKISNLENNKIKNSRRFLDIFNFGLKPNHALAFGLSIVMIIASLVYFSKIDQIPNVKIADYKNQNLKDINNNNQYIGNMQNLTNSNKKDSLNKKIINKKNNSLPIDTPPIQVVNRPK